MSEQDLIVQMGIDINNLRNARDQLQKDLTEARAQIAWLKRRDEMLREQFAFSLKYDQRVDPGPGWPKL